MPGEAAAAVVREFKETRSYIFGRVLDVPQGEQVEFTMRRQGCRLWEN